MKPEPTLTVPMRLKLKARKKLIYQVEAQHLVLSKIMGKISENFRAREKILFSLTDEALIANGKFTHGLLSMAGLYGPECGVDKDTIKAGGRIWKHGLKHFPES